MELDLSWAAPVALLTGYLIGSVPFGLLIAQWVAGIDLRQHGSHNIGATNVARTLGLKWGACVLALDALKGLLPVLLLPPLLLAGEDAALEHVRVGTGLAAVCGHMFPCWIGFRGGKGVATSLGVVAVLAPWATLAAFCVFGVTLAVTRFVSVSSMLASIAFALAELILLRPSPFSEAHWSLAAFSLAVPALIVARHRGNIVRLWRGEEAKLSRGGAAHSDSNAKRSTSEG